MALTLRAAEATMADPSLYQKRREELSRHYLQSDAPALQPVYTGGVDHLALISSDLEATIHFYTEVIGMRLTRIVQNRDEPTSTHIFLDMGGGNQLAFFDFPEKGPARTVRGVGSMHHVPLKAHSDRLRSIITTPKEVNLSYPLHGSPESGSHYVHDPDNLLLR